MKIICRSLFYVLTYCLSIAVSYANYDDGLTGVGFDRTRVIYSEKAGGKGVSVTFKNNTDNVFLLQSFMMAPNSLVLSPSALANIVGEDIPFFVAPPLLRLERNSRHVLRIIKKKSELPSDRESVFLLVAKTIPNTSKSAQSNDVSEMVFTLSTILKVFYRPVSLPDKGLSTIPEQLRFSWEPGKLVVTNPSPFYLTLAGIEVGGKVVEGEGYKDRYWMVPPRAEMKYSLPDNLSGSVRISFLDEDGIAMPWINTNINCSTTCAL